MRVSTAPAEPDISQVPDPSGHFGVYGGLCAPESLMAAIEQLAKEYEAARKDPGFTAELDDLLRNYAARPTLVTEAKRFGSEFAGGATVLLKREDLAHTGSHKINNVLGQVLLTKRMGKTRVIAETGAGQHGVATATACALLGLECVVYMGEEDTRRQALNVSRMRMLGATVVPVTAGTKTLKDAMNEAFRDWVTTVDHTHYCIGSVGGPHPFPMMVRDFQRVIGIEARQQVLYHAFIRDEGVRLIGCEAGGDGDGRPERTAATLTLGSPGVLHGMRTYVLQDAEGQTLDTHSISAGLDYPGVGPEHSWLKDIGRAEYRSVSDSEAMEGFAALCKTEGIIPALESAHAVAGAMRLGRELGPEALILVNLSGRGDKDVATASAYFGV